MCCPFCVLQGLREEKNEEVYGWRQENPGRRNLQRSLIMVNLSEIFLSEMLNKVQSGVWV